MTQKIIKAVRGGSLRGRLGAFLIAAGREPLAMLVPPGSVRPRPKKPLIDLIGLPWEQYAALRAAAMEIELTEETAESMKDLTYDMKCGYVAYDCHEKRQVLRVDPPRAASVALLSESVYRELTGADELEVSIIDLEELLGS